MVENALAVLGLDCLVSATGIITVVGSNWAIMKYFNNDYDNGLHCYDVKDHSCPETN